MVPYSVYNTTSTQQLLSYTKCVFSESEVYTGNKAVSGRKRTKEACVYERICYYWHQLLYETDRKSTIEQFPIGLSWFLFDIIVKSMVLKVHRSNELSDFTNRRGRFKEEVFNQIGKILQKLLVPSICQSRNINPHRKLSEGLAICLRPQLYIPANRRDINGILATQRPPLGFHAEAYLLARHSLPQ